MYIDTCISVITSLMFVYISFSYINNIQLVRKINNFRRIISNDYELKNIFLNENNINYSEMLINLNLELYYNDTQLKKSKIISDFGELKEHIYIDYMWVNFECEKDEIVRKSNNPLHSIHLYKEYKEHCRVTNCIPIPMYEIENEKKWLINEEINILKNEKYIMLPDKRKKIILNNDKITICDILVDKYQINLQNILIISIVELILIYPFIIILNRCINICNLFYIFQ